MPTVNVPGVGKVRFPDDMAPADIEKAISEDILTPPSAAIPHEDLRGGSGDDALPMMSESPRSTMPSFLKAAGLVMASAAVPPAAPALSLPYLGNLALRAGASGAGTTGGGVLGRAYTGEGSEPADMASDFALGAGTELGGEMLAIPLSVAARGGAFLGRGALKKLGFFAQDAAQNVAGKASRDAFQRVGELVGDADIPAPRTLEVLKRMRDPEGGWTRDARAIFSAGSGRGQKTVTVEAIAGAGEGGLPMTKGNAWKVRYAEDPAKIDPKAAGLLSTPQSQGWAYHYLVLDDGNGILLAYNPDRKIWKVPSQRSGGLLKGKEFSRAREAFSYAARAGYDGVPVGLVSARPTSTGEYLTRGVQFTVDRVTDGIPWEQLNALHSVSRTLGDNFGNLSPKGKELFYALRDAVESDIRAAGPKIERAYDAAMRAARWRANPSAEFGTAVRTGVRKGAPPLGVFTIDQANEMMRQARE